MDAVTEVPRPVNEPVLEYAPNSPERARLVRPIVDDLVQVELDARLDHQRDDPRPRGFQARRNERPSMRFDGELDGLRRRHRELREFLCRTTRHRHFRADHVDR